jgi:hypothetical protein
VRKIQTQSFKKEQNYEYSSEQRPFDSGVRDSSRDPLYQSAQRQPVKRRGTAIFQSVGRLMDDQVPSGSRSNHIYSSPHFKPNSSYNFWNDLTLNQYTRNKWEHTSFNPGEDNAKVEVALGFKTIRSTSDLISLQVNNNLGDAQEAFSPSKRANQSSVVDCTL